MPPAPRGCRHASRLSIGVSNTPGAIVLTLISRLAEIASGHQGDAMNRGFACRVGRLADLAVEGRDRSGEYYRPAFAIDRLSPRDLSGP